MLKELEVHEFEKELIRKGVLLLDVRTEEEFSYGHLKEAKNVPVADLEHILEQFSCFRNDPVLIYCRSGIRSVTAGNILITEGFSNVAHLRMGMTGWVMSGKEIVLG